MFGYCLLVVAPLLHAAVLHGLKRVYRLDRPPGYRGVSVTFFIIYYCMLAFRASSVGLDTENYLARFWASQNMGLWDYLASRTSEPGLSLVEKFVGLFTHSDQVYLAVTAALTVIPVAVLYYRESEQPVMSMAVFLILPLFGMFFSGLRQSLAIAVVAAAFPFVRGRKPVKFLLMIGLAAFFHTSAWIAAAIYPVYHLRLSKWSLLWILPGLALVYLFNDRLFLLMLSLAGDGYTERYGVITATGAYAMFALFALLFIFSNVFLDEGNPDPETMGLRNLLAVSVGLQCFAMVNTIAMRLNYYFLLFMPLLMSRVVGRVVRRNRWFGRIVGLALVVYFLYYFLDRAFTRSGDFGIYPYIPFWEG